MTDTSRLRALTRRELLACATAVGTVLVVGPGFVAHTSEAWASEVNGLEPATMATLIQMSRDIYPHDRVADKHYAITAKAHDDKAAKDPEYKAMIEDGIALINRLAKASGHLSYAAVPWEIDRTAILRQVEAGKCFQAVRGGMVVGLYNQKELWPLFGYEGESFSKGGYINRGFDDIAWL